MLKLIFQISRSLLHDVRSRRLLMFYSMLGALFLLFLGAIVLDGWLRERPLLFLAFWGACAAVTAFSTLLACFDMLAVRAEERAQRRRMERQIFDPDSDHENPR